MKLIILILANDNYAYTQMQELWRKYMNTHENIKSYFMKYDSTLESDIEIINDTIFIKGIESYIPGCLDKTVKSIDFLLKNEEFDYVFRTNLSSVVHLNKLYSLLNSNIKYGGVIGYTNNANFQTQTNDKQPFVSGSGILISKNICNLIVTNKTMLKYNVIDDVSLAELLINFNINFTHLERYYFSNYNNEIVNDVIVNHHHFRCKVNEDSLKTVELMRKIINIIYII
jgi:hypothetical protein